MGRCFTARMVVWSRVSKCAPKSLAGWGGRETKLVSRLENEDKESHGKGRFSSRIAVQDQILG